MSAHEPEREDRIRQRGNTQVARIRPGCDGQPRRVSAEVNMLLRAVSLLLLAGCAAAPAPACPAPPSQPSQPVETPQKSEAETEAELVAHLSEQQRTARRVAMACVRGEVKACQSIADSRAASERDSPASKVAVAQAEVSKESNRRDEEAALGQKLLKAPGPDSLRAPDHLKVACDLGHAGACNDLGWTWGQGFGAMQRDVKKAAELYELACDLGSNLGCLNRGRLARDNNTALAARFMARACDRESEDACVALAGTVAEAEAACKKSSADCNNWGVIQDNGYGVSVDSKKAFANFERACSAHVAIGCFNAGLHLRDGDAGKVDLAGAKRRFAASCKAGYDPGCRQAALLK